MKAFSTPRRRIVWFLAAAAAIVLLDRAFAPYEAAEAVVVGAVTRGRVPAPGSPDAGPATRVSVAPPAATTVARTGPQNDLERIARWQRTRGARPDVAAAASAARDRDGDDDQARLDPFAPVAWAAPATLPVRAARPPPAPPPVAPPFPYTYIGGLSDAGVRTLFFTKGERVLALKVGDVVDSLYRIDAIDDKQMTLTFVPMNESAVIALGEAR